MLALLLAGIGGFLAARWYGNHLLFARTRLDPDEFPLEYRNGVSYIYDRPEAPVVVVFSHGSGGNLTQRRRIRDLFAQTNYGFLIYDYYGYGASQDVPTLMMNETALTRAAQEMLELTRGKQIILMGASLGCYPTCWMAAQHPDNLLGVILCVPFDRIGSVVKVAPYLLGAYDNLALCRRIEVPTLLVRAAYDQLMPWSVGDRLLEALGQLGHLITVPTNHQGYLTEQLEGELLRFIDEVGEE